MRIHLVIFQSNLIFPNSCLGLLHLKTQKTVKPFSHSCSTVASIINMSSLESKTPIHLAGNSRTVLTTNITGEYTADKKPKDKWRNSGRARGTGRRGGTRIVNDTTEPVPGAQSISEKPKPSPRPRPTHCTFFLSSSVPLNLS